MKTLTKWKLAATGVVGGLVFLLTRPAKAAPKPVAKPPAPPQTVITGSTGYAASGAVTETYTNHFTGQDYKVTWTKAEWAKREAALDAGDPYFEDTWKRVSEMTDADWAKIDARPIIT